MELPNKKIVYLHVGTHKTGTTSLQKHLYDNRRILEEKGYYFPENGYQKGHCHLAWEINGDKRYMSRFGSWEELIKEISSSENKNIIISSEDFLYTNSGELKKIKEYFKDSTIKIIFYLRRQDQYLKSLFFENIQQGKYKESFKKWFTENESRGNYLHILYKFEQIFGKENLFIRAYNKTNFISDFLQTIGLSLEDFPIKEYRFNQSLNWKIINLVRIKSKRYWYLDQKNRMELNLKSLSDKKVAFLAKYIPSWVFPEYPNEKILQRYEDINKTIQKEYDINLL